ncbi:MAG: hypothetical protein ACRDWE_05270 [Acidimicrobiales bacterium]
MRRRRAADQFEFRPDALAPVIEWMDRLAGAHDGWINLLPGAPEDAVEQPSGGAFSALFGVAPAPVSMCTWIPARPRRSGDGEEAVGIMHSKGRAAAQLATMGIGVPAGWRTGQDHPRRGLVVHPFPGTPHADVLAWSLRAGAALAALPLSGSWRAQIHLPREQV